MNTIHRSNLRISMNLLNINPENKKNKEAPIMEQKEKNNTVLIKKKMFGRMAYIFLVCLLLGGTFVFFANTWVVGGSEQYIVSEKEAENFDAECILILGARVYEDGRPSLILRDRIQRGVELYHSGAGKKILLSGDHGTIDYDEVNAMKEYALQLGVPKDDIFMDHAGFSTYDSLYRAKYIFGAKKIIVVTQRFHLFRSVYIARKLGIDALGVEANLYKYPAKTNIKNEIREDLARSKDWVYVNLLQPKPRYLGDPIDLSGSGTVTFD